MSYSRATRLVLTLLVASSMSVVGCKSSSTKKSNKPKAEAQDNLVQFVDEHLQELKNEIGPVEDYSWLPIFNSDYAVSEVLETAEAMLRGEASIDELKNMLSQMTRDDIEAAVKQLAILKTQRSEAKKFSKEMSEQYDEIAQHVESLNKVRADQKGNAEGVVLGGAAVVVATVFALRGHAISGAIEKGLFRVLSKPRRTVRGWQVEEMMQNSFMNSGRLTATLKLANAKNLAASHAAKDADALIGVLVQATGFSRNLLRGVRPQAIQTKTAKAAIVEHGLKLRPTRVSGVRQAAYKNNDKQHLIFEITAGKQKFFVRYSERLPLTGEQLGNAHTLRLMKEMKRQAKLEARYSKVSASINEMMQGGQLRTMSDELPNLANRLAPAIEKSKLITAEAAIASARLRAPLREAKLNTIRKQAEDLRAAIAKRPSRPKGKTQAQRDKVRAQWGRQEAQLASLDAKLASSRLLLDLDQSLRMQRFHAGLEGKNAVIDARIAAAKAKQAAVTEKIIAQEMVNVEAATAHLGSKPMSEVVKRSGNYGEWSVVTIEVNKIQSLPLSIEQAAAQSLAPAATLGGAGYAVVSAVLFSHMSISSDKPVVVSYDPVDSTVLLDEIAKEIVDETGKASSEEATPSDVEASSEENHYLEKAAKTLRMFTVPAGLAE